VSCGQLGRTTQHGSDFISFFVVTVPLQQLQMVSEFSTAGVVIGFGRTILEVFFYAFLLRVHLGWIVFVNWFGPNTT
jgi:hypothetical protein